MLKDLFSLQGKTALVTGASSGLGREIAVALSRVGAHIIAVGRNAQRLNETADTIKKENGACSTVVCDLSNETELLPALQSLENTPIDILVNNAGIAGKTPLEQSCNEQWDKLIAINLKSVWNITQAISQQMVEKKIPGSIINIASINGGNVPFTGASGYAATKAAVCQLSKALSGELAPHHIRINTILPGLFHTELTKEKISAHEATFNNMIPLGFIATPSDINGLILYLAANQASRYVTGAEFIIDGGMSANCKTL